MAMTSLAATPSPLERGISTLSPSKSFPRRGSASSSLSPVAATLLPACVPLLPYSTDTKEMSSASSSTSQCVAAPVTVTEDVDGDVTLGVEHRVLPGDSPLACALADLVKGMTFVWPRDKEEALLVDSENSRILVMNIKNGNPILRCLVQGKDGVEEIDVLVDSGASRGLSAKRHKQYGSTSVGKALRFVTANGVVVSREVLHIDFKPCDVRKMNEDDPLIQLVKHYEDTDINDGYAAPVFEGVDEDDDKPLSSLVDHSKIPKKPQSKTSSSSSSSSLSSSSSSSLSSSSSSSSSLTSSSSPSPRRLVTAVIKAVEHVSMKSQFLAEF